jgi:hypothetical protein
MKTRRLVQGVGINDSTEIVNKSITLPHPKGKQIQKHIWTCPYYSIWVDMLKRCYSAKYLAKYPSYEGCSVCPEWLYFTKFKAWMETQDWEGKELDKDIICMGNKVYSPENCMFVSKQINYLLLTGSGKRGSFPIGARETRSGKFQAYCSENRKTNWLVTFPTYLEAHKQWKIFKLMYIKSTISEQTDPRIILGLSQRVAYLEQTLITGEVVDKL